MARQPHILLPLPKGWPRRVRSAAIHAIALARLALTTARGQSNSGDPGSGRIARLTEELLVIKEELRIKDARMKSIPAQRRPHYLPTERLAILELRAARAWSQAQTADHMLITTATIASWMRRLDEEGPAALVQMHEPVNRFPDFVAHVVRKLKILCPTMGKVRISQFLARAGLHLGSTTVARMLASSSSPFDKTQPDLECGSHHHPNRLRFLGALAAVGAASALALLLVGGCHRGSLLSAHHGYCRVHPESNQCRCSPDARQGDSTSRHCSGSPNHGSGTAVHRRRIPSMVPPSRHQAEIRGRPEVRQHFGRRAAHADHEERGAASNSRASRSETVPTRSRPLRRVVQRTPAPQHSGNRNTR